jgi:uncharacterized protein YggU (UPF0235/DUF167 family)
MSSKTRLAVRLTPRGGREAIDGWAVDGDGRPYLKVRVAAPPVEGAANAALLALLAKALGVPKSSLSIVGGRRPAQAGRCRRLRRVVAGARPGIAARGRFLTRPSKA